MKICLCGTIVLLGAVLLTEGRGDQSEDRLKTLEIQIEDLSLKASFPGSPYEKTAPMFLKEFKESVLECEQRQEKGILGTGQTEKIYTQALEFYLGVRSKVEPGKGVEFGKQVSAIEAPLIGSPKKDSPESITSTTGEDLDLDSLHKSAKAFRLAWFKYAGDKGLGTLISENGQWPLLFFQSWTREFAIRTPLLTSMSVEADMPAVAAVAKNSQWLNTIDERALNDICVKWVHPLPDGLTAKYNLIACRSNSREFIDRLLQTNSAFSTVVSQPMLAEFRQLTSSLVEETQSGAKANPDDIAGLLRWLDAMTAACRKNSGDGRSRGSEAVNSNLAANADLQSLVAYSDQAFLSGAWQKLQGVSKLPKPISDPDRRKQMDAASSFINAVSERKTRLGLKGGEDAFSEIIMQSLGQYLTDAKGILTAKFAAPSSQ
jgi:hypothetical protein